MNKKERWYDARYPLDNPYGVRHVFEDYDKLVEYVELSSDFDAMNVLIDFEKALEDAKLTKKQIEALYYVFFEKMTQEEAADLLGIAQKNVSVRIDTAIRNIAESQGFDEEVFIEKYGH